MSKKVCVKCLHYEKCVALFSCKQTSVKCDWEPSKWKPNYTLLQSRIVRLEEYKAHLADMFRRLPSRRELDERWKSVTDVVKALDAVLGKADD